MGAQLCQNGCLFMRLPLGVFHIFSCVFFLPQKQGPHGHLSRRLLAQPRNQLVFGELLVDELLGACGTIYCWGISPQTQPLS